VARGERTSHERGAPFHRFVRAHVRGVRGLIAIHAGVLRGARAYTRTDRASVRNRHDSSVDLRTVLRTACRPHTGAPGRPRRVHGFCRDRCSWALAGGWLLDAVDDQCPSRGCARADYDARRCSRTGRRRAGRWNDDIRVRLGTRNRLGGLHRRHAGQWASGERVGTAIDCYVACGAALRRGLCRNAGARTRTARTCPSIRGARSCGGRARTAAYPVVPARHTSFRSRARQPFDA
jgi:hypothetical protein